MIDEMSRSGHTFHIPVMGTGYTIDTPLRVAKYGISSVISLVDDVLIEQMRKLHCRRAGEPFEPIEKGEDDVRARRITAWLNFIDRQVQKQVEELRQAPFEPGSEITRYFELLPDGKFRQAYEEMLSAAPGQERDWMQAQLRKAVTAGSVDANIMSKSDWNTSGIGGYEDPTVTDAAQALRGFAKSTLNSSMVFSAGMNPRSLRLCGLVRRFLSRRPGTAAEDDHPQGERLPLGRYPGQVPGQARPVGVGVSHRVGFELRRPRLCYQGAAAGPDSGRVQKVAYKSAETASRIAQKGLRAVGKNAPWKIRPKCELPCRGGIGTAAEDQFLMERYGVDGTGWATPFFACARGVQRRRRAPGKNFAKPHATMCF